MSVRTHMLGALAFLALAGTAGAQTAAGSSTRPRSPSTATPGATAAPLDSASTPEAAGASSVAPANARDPGYATPGAPTTLASVYATRSGPLCDDFRATPGAGWAATAAVQFPGPQGLVQVSLGQIVTPGDYVQGFDLGSVLQRECPRPVETPSAPPPTG